MRYNFQRYYGISIICISFCLLGCGGFFGAFKPLNITYPTNQPALSHQSYITTSVLIGNSDLLSAPAFVSDKNKHISHLYVQGKVTNGTNSFKDAKPIMLYELGKHPAININDGQSLLHFYPYDIASKEQLQYQITTDVLEKNSVPSIIGDIFDKTSKLSTVQQAGGSAVQVLNFASEILTAFSLPEHHYAYSMRYDNILENNQPYQVYFIIPTKWNSEKTDDTGAIRNKFLEILDSKYTLIKDGSSFKVNYAGTDSSYRATPYLVVVHQTSNHVQADGLLPRTIVSSKNINQKTIESARRAIDGDQSQHMLTIEQHQYEFALTEYAAKYVEFDASVSSANDVSAKKKLIEQFNEQYLYFAGIEKNKFYQTFYEPRFNLLKTAFDQKLQSQLTSASNTMRLVTDAAINPALDLRTLSRLELENLLLRINAVIKYVEIELQRDPTNVEVQAIKDSKLYYSAVSNAAYVGLILLDRHYKQSIDSLRIVNCQNGRNVRDHLQKQIVATSCDNCRTVITSAIKEFDQKCTEDHTLIASLESAGAAATKARTILFMDSANYTGIDVPAASKARVENLINVMLKITRDIIKESANRDNESESEVASFKEQLGTQLIFMDTELRKIIEEKAKPKKDEVG